ncbi:NAD(P)/FAD-dependent oxidoreductase [Owenweeksia hongkongensis]|uniref:NAD(P)/FAD-dependent oxidoreductase n=1 Tax=Owenweeksia hongkongensis TaxID=253245 RepID=UPI003A8CC43F
MKKCDVVVIGAGPSGSLAASVLQQKGWEVTILEKQRFPRFVIGESLLPRCMESLEEAGLMNVVEKLGFQKKVGARFYKDGEICDFDFSQQFTEGWSWTWQAPRSELDMALAEEVASRGVNLEYEATVTHIDFGAEKQAVYYTDDAGKEEVIECKFVIDGSGYGRVVPRMLGLDKPSDLAPRMAVFGHVKYDAIHEYDKRIDIVTVTDKIWAWLIPFSDGRASVGFVGVIEAFDHLKDLSDKESLLKLIASSAYIAPKLGDVEFTMEAKKISAYSSAVSRFHGEGFVLTGNSTEFLDPIFSSGVTFAMESGVLAAKLLDRQLRGEAVDWDTEYVAYIQRGVDTFRSYVKGWYDGSLPKIFFSPSSLQQFKDQICSVLAGYVWDESNPFVKKHSRILTTLSKVLDIQMDKPGE